MVEARVWGTLHPTSGNDPDCQEEYPTRSWCHADLIAAFLVDLLDLVVGRKVELARGRRPLAAADVRVHDCLVLLAKFLYGRSSRHSVFQDFFLPASHWHHLLSNRCAVGVGSRAPSTFLQNGR